MHRWFAAVCVGGLLVGCGARAGTGSESLTCAPAAAAAISSVAALPVVLDAGVAPVTVNDDCRAPDVATLRHAEIQDLVAADQQARKGLIGGHSSREDLDKLEREDRNRRERVAALFGAGCFKVSADFLAGALIFQHGDVPDHYLQAFGWAKRAVDLGDPAGKRLMALTIDRFLVHSGRAQLFGSQSLKEAGSDCWCTLRIEPSFPDELRREYLGTSAKDKAAEVARLNAGHTCPDQPCSRVLDASPRGTVPGFW